MAKAIPAAILAAFFALGVAMCVAPPPSAVLGPGAAINSGDTAWMLASTALVLLQTPGVAFFYGGMMEHKNVVAAMMQSIIPMGVVPLFFAFLGFSLAFGPDLGYPGFIGDPKVYGLMYNVGAAPDTSLAATIPLTVYFMFQTAFAVITPALIIGSVADRVNFSALCVFIALWHLMVYCPLAHMVWTTHGLVHAFGVLDFAGGAVVHMSSGWSALVFAIYLGPRKMSLGEMASATAHTKKPANLPYVILGAALLWFGWFGFNAGSAGSASPLAGQAFLNTNTAAASAMLTWLLIDQIKGVKMGPCGWSCGVIVGLVAITPAAGFVNVGAAALIGIIGASATCLAQVIMDRWGHRYVNDTLDVFTCHGIGGTTGMICTSLFSTVAVNPTAPVGTGADGAFYGHPMALGKALLTVVVLVTWLMTFTYGLLWITDHIVSLRVTEEEEQIGLDVSKHGGEAIALHALAHSLSHSFHGTGTFGCMPGTTVVSPVPAAAGASEGGRDGKGMPAAAV